MASQTLACKMIFLLLIAFLMERSSSGSDMDRVTIDKVTNNALDGALSYLAPVPGLDTGGSGGGPSASPKRTGARRTNKSKSNRTAAARRPTVRRIVHPSLHAAWDEYNHLCALAKFQATFTIKYDTSSGSTSQLIDKMPLNARSKGRCDQFDDEPVLDIMWKDIHQSSFSNSQQNSTLGFTFRIIFQKYTEDDDRWGVQQMQLLYNTGHSVFRGVSQPKKFIVRSNKDDYRLQFRTNFGRSVLCPSPPPIQMYDSDGTLRVIARLSNMQLQAFEFSDPRQGSNFDEFERCGQVSFGSGVARQNLKRAKYDGLTFTIGIMTVCIAVLTVVGYAIYRSNALKTKQYKTMAD
jgi:hypothetical protein